MGKQSGYLLRQAEREEQFSRAVQMVTRQFMVDTLQIALHRYEGFGYDRLRRIADEWEKVRHDYERMNDISYVEADALQEHMDREFREICKGHGEIIPYRERYPEIKEIKYDRRMK